MNGYQFYQIINDMANSADLLYPRGIEINKDHLT